MESPSNGNGRFAPIPLFVLGIVGWVLLTIVASWLELKHNDYPLVVILFGISLTAVAMAVVASWCTLLFVLLWNWCLSSRRRAFKKELLSWTPFFGIMTVLATLSLLFVGG
ncbi:hypothetical protein [Aeoliella sp. SH292]|uniref:hypothetical protein n=1 Tax=Aeoliella sp. SH292 TaxID=3454464 RepID=UPI003F9B3469